MGGEPSACPFSYRRAWQARAGSKFLVLRQHFSHGELHHILKRPVLVSPYPNFTFFTPLWSGFVCHIYLIFAESDRLGRIRSGRELGLEGCVRFMLKERSWRTESLRDPHLLVAVVLMFVCRLVPIRIVAFTGTRCVITLIRSPADRRLAWRCSFLVR